MKNTLISILAVIGTHSATAQNFTSIDSAHFKYGHQKIVLLKDTSGKKLILFKTGLAVNTDGIPLSYHPYDLRGESKAINSITNGAYIYRLKDGANLSVPRQSAHVPKGGYSTEERSKMATEAFTVFEHWRDAGYPDTFPTGYKISWSSALLSVNGKPCIFQNGKYEGYFASTTALTNGLTKDKGECNCNDQVDPFEIPALVLAAHEKDKQTKKVIYLNPVRTFGASLGDLVLAYNLNTKHLVYAIVGDSGPADNLGEGSVILNMKLKGTGTYPKTKNETYGLAISKDVMICIIPASKNIARERPYTEQNIQKRIENWFQSIGISSEAGIIQFLENTKKDL